MKFPGRRKSKHYFPVTERNRFPVEQDFFSQQGQVSLLGLDQVMVDIDIFVDDEFLKSLNIEKGSSHLFEEDRVERILEEAKKGQKIRGVYPGGAIGNTIHNFCVLADNSSFLLGAMSKTIEVGDEAYLYISKTSAKVDLSYLATSNGAIGRALSFITPDGERTFGISSGVMNQFGESDVPVDLITHCSAVVLSAYHFRRPDSPIAKAALKIAKVAGQNNIPVVMTLGTSHLVSETQEELWKFIKKYVNILAMNTSEAQALTGLSDPLLAGQLLLDSVDLALITLGREGLYLCGLVDRDQSRPTKDSLHSKSIPNYNEFEYSRAMLRNDCAEPVKIFSHINPFLGGPSTIRNTNGAGDAALSALLHDLAANVYHRELIPKSPKHQARFLTYSSLSQICKYANRVSYEVLRQNSPRLYRALPSREEDLEEIYWEK